MKKALIVICSKEYVRNYLTTKAFSEVENEYTCQYLFSDKVGSLDWLGLNSTGLQFSANPSIESAHYDLFNVLMWKHRSKSSSFYFRAMRNRRIQYSFSENISVAARALKVGLQLCRALFRWMIESIRDNDIVFPIYFRWHESKLVINANLEEKVRKFSPDIILFPSSAYDPVGTDLVKIGRNIGVPVIFLIDNWDNLSSKSILWEKPAYIGVWGRQSADHAQSIQGFKADQVVCLGTPRFDSYFQLRDQSLPLKFNFRYILFVGTSLAFDEADVLYRLNRVIEKNLKLLNSIKILYRPHPWRQGSDSIIGLDLEHVVIDPQMIESYARDQATQDIQPNLSYYPSLIQNAEFVMGGLTSMLIEALIFRKRFMALVYDDGKNFTSQHNAFKYYTHFQGLRDISAMTFCEDIHSLESVFLEAWFSRGNIDRELVDFQRRYFYFDDNRSYAIRLKDLCSMALKKHVIS
jgi:hypothetical protein